MYIAAYAGRFHPLLVHLPIGIILLGVLLAFLSRRKPFSADWLRLIFLLGALSATVSTASGFLIATAGSYDAPALNSHRATAIVLTLLSWLLWWSTGRPGTIELRLQRILLILVPVVLTITGHLGGTLTHGSDFLEPPPLNMWFQSPSAPVKALGGDDRVYDAVALVLREKCVSCHGPVRQRGELRLDSFGAILTGGKNGPALVAGHKSDSELLRRIALPADDEKHMPPVERVQITDQEIRLIAWWIETGASTDLKIAEAVWPDSVDHPLHTQQNDRAVPAQALIPPGPVDPAEPGVVDSLNRLGVSIVPVSENSNYLQASFAATEPENYSAALSLLPQLRDQLIWIRMGRIPIGEAELRQIAALAQLRRLNLSSCLRPATSLDALGALTRLEHLNLTGNELTTADLAMTGGLPSLRSLYLFGSSVGANDTAGLRTVFPNARFELGGYVVPTLPTDTTFLDM